MKAVKNIFSQKGIITFLVILLLSGSYIIFSITKPNTFHDGDVITAENMNENFDALYAKVTELEGKITIPPGTIVAFGGNKDSVPAGWLLCDGTPYSEDKYPDLRKVIGMSYGTEGGTIFRVPDLRGMFLRGVDAGAGNDPDVATRTVNGNGETDAPGSIQADAFQGHWHKFEKRLLGRFGSSDRVETDNNNGDYLNNTRDPISDGVNGESRTSSETRPKNVYVNYIIKY